MPLILVSIPKAGTNLIVQAVGPPAQDIPRPITFDHPLPDAPTLDMLRHASIFTYGHPPFHPVYLEAIRQRGHDLVFLQRDPRDVIVSWAYWIRRSGEAGGGLLNPEVSRGVRVSDTPDPIKHLIRIAPAHLSRYLPWLETADVVVRFEDLAENRLAGFNRLFAAMSVEVQATMQSPRHMLIRSFIRRSVTYRRGLVGEWRTHFTREHNRIINRTCGAVMDALGYAREELDQEVGVRVPPEVSYGNRDEPTDLEALGKYGLDLSNASVRLRRMKIMEWLS